MARRLRLLKVIVQPVFVVDDDDAGLVEQAAQPVVVSAQQWPSYATTEFVRAFEELRAAVEQEEPGREDSARRQQENS